jgi:hypothetical protein
LRKSSSENSNQQQTFYHQGLMKNWIIYFNRYQA